MPSWILKAALQGVMSRLPNPRRWNELFQRHVTRSLELDDETVEDKWRHCVDHLAHYEQATGNSPSGRAVLELGTGWHPVVPVGLLLRGVGHVYTVDSDSLLSRSRILDVVRRLLDRVDAGSVDEPDPDALTRMRLALAAGHNLSQNHLLELLGITAIVGDARSVPIPSETIDLFVSNNTFEHIPPDVLTGILREMRRTAVHNAVGSHYIDMSDHYSNFDDSISAYNYLKYSHRVWKLFDSELQHQNRLRLPDYRKLTETAGWSIVSEEHKLGSLEELRRIRLSRDFAHYSEQELRIYAAWMVLRVGTLASN